MKSKRLFRTTLKSVIKETNRGDDENFKMKTKIIYKKGYREKDGLKIACSAATI